MISEKIMEDAICVEPEKYIEEKGLRLIGRQFRVGSYIFDLLFEDRHGAKLIVELQKGTLDRNHTYKILDYYDEYKINNPKEFIELMVIANRIPFERRTKLDSHGISWKEIPESEFSNIAELYSSKVTSGPVETLSDHIKEIATLETTKSLSQVKPSYIDELAIKIPTLSSARVISYSNAEIDDLQSAISSFYRIVLPRKIKREAEAADILRQFRGRYTVDILDKVFDLADRDPTGPWFGQMLSRPNRNRLYRCLMADLNIMIDRLLETGELGWLWQWRRAGNRGMNAGTATLLMYLYSPDSYNIWLPKTHGGLSQLGKLDGEYPRQKVLPLDEYGILYKRFNDKAISVREENALLPQAMDWFLWAVTEIKKNPENRSFRGYVEGRKK